MGLPRDLGVPGSPDPPELAWVPGSFGENFTIEGQDETSVCLGDRYGLGDGVVVEVSIPRGPCWKIGRRWRLPALVARVNETARTGWYLRVLREGHVEAGQPLILVDRLRGEA